MKLSILVCFLFVLPAFAEEMISVEMTGNSAGKMRTSFPGGYVLQQNFDARYQNKQFNFGSVLLCKKDSSNGIYIKHSGDDACPWNFNSTYIGANHGDSNCYAIICKQPHGLTAKDCGTTWHDSKGEAFHIVKIENKNTFWVLSSNKGKGKGPWKFIKPTGTQLKNDAGRTISDYTVQYRQLYSPVRILSRVFKADGKVLPDKCQVKCKVFTVEETYDIVATDAILAHVLKNKGKQVSFNAPELERVLTQKIVYSFYPNNSCIVTHNTEFFRDVHLGYMGFLQSSPLLPGKEYAQHLYYIPKCKPVKYEGQIWDFASCLDYTRNIKNAMLLGPETFENPKSMPERFVQYLQKGKNYPDIGFVCGYSLLEGCTTPEQHLKGAYRALFLYKSRKTYPYAIDGTKTKIKAGQKFYCMAYRQFFVPSACSYSNQQGKYKVFYADFHTPVKNKVLFLPSGLASSEMSVVEKSSTVNFVKVKNGLSFTSTGKYGYAVLKFK